MAAQPSLIRVVNRAAVWLGSSARIASLDDPKPLAEAAVSVLDFARDELLASHPWNFAIRFRSCAAVSIPDHERGNYARAFEKPADMLRFLPARPDEDWGGFDVIEQEYFLSDAPAPLIVRCVVRVEDPSKWSPGFNAALAAQLALEIAPTITGADTLDRKLTARLDAAIAKGKRQDGLASGQRARISARLSSWLGAREAGGREGQYGPPIV